MGLGADTIFPLDYVHARRFATREARRHAGDLYPGPVLMPRGLLRALDPLIAITLGPARTGDPEFEASFERMLRVSLRSIRSKTFMAPLMPIQESGSGSHRRQR